MIPLSISKNFFSIAVLAVAFSGVALAATSIGRIFDVISLMQTYPLIDKPLRLDELASEKAFTVNLVQFKGSIKPHFHNKHDELVISLGEGGTITIGGSAYPLTQGALFTIPKGTIHQADCVAGDACRAYSIFTPHWNPQKPDRVFIEK